MDKTNREPNPRGGEATYLSKGQETIALPPNRTALLVIDPVNDFLSEGGAGYEMTKGGGVLAKIFELNRLVFTFTSHCS